MLLVRPNAASSRSWALELSFDTVSKAKSPRSTRHVADPDALANAGCGHKPLRASPGAGPNGAAVPRRVSVVGNIQSLRGAPREGFEPIGEM